MKIQDIFKLPNTKGKSKLFNKIMRKYGIPKQDSKQLKNDIDNFSSGGGSSIEYLDVRSLDDVTKLILVNGALAFNGSMTMGDKVVKMVSPFGSFGIAGTTIDLSELKFIAIDFGFKIGSTDKIQSIKDTLIEKYNYTEDQLAAIPRITKEEFYKID